MRNAISRAKTTFSITWLGGGHEVQGWAELLIAERLHLNIPHSQDVALKIQSCGKKFRRLWTESLRYHKNVAYSHEMNQVREAAEWLLARSEDL